MKKRNKQTCKIKKASISKLLPLSTGRNKSSYCRIKLSKGHINSASNQFREDQIRTLKLNSFVEKAERINYGSFSEFLLEIITFCEEMIDEINCYYKIVNKIFDKCTPQICHKIETARSSEHNRFQMCFR